MSISPLGTNYDGDNKFSIMLLHYKNNVNVNSNVYVVSLSTTDQRFTRTYIIGTCLNNNVNKTNFLNYTYPLTNTQKEYFQEKIKQDLLNRESPHLNNKQQHCPSRINICTIMEKDLIETLLPSELQTLKGMLQTWYENHNTLLRKCINVCTICYTKQELSTILPTDVIETYF
jgi:hypothetical protein